MNESSPPQTSTALDPGRLPRITLGERALSDYELLSSGGFRPLTRFMGHADYISCLNTLRLADGQLFPIPVTLPVHEPLAAGTRAALAHPRGDILATIEVRETFTIDPRAEAMALFSSVDESHSYIREILLGPTYRLDGVLTPLRAVPHSDFESLRLTPAQVHARLAELGRKHVVAFQTRNPLHRAHEEMVKQAAADHDATLLLHPAVGLTKPGDIDHFTRVRTYRLLVEKYFAPNSTVLSLLPLAMRMAGPREALLHAIVRKNFGATHFIVGRDHAGPGLDGSGRPFFAPYAAQELVQEHAAEIGITMVPFREVVYLPEQDRFVEEDKVPPGAPVLSFSGSDLRRRLNDGQNLPEWFTRPETAAILRQALPPRIERGFCVWFTGLSGAGKSVTAEALRSLLMEDGRVVTLLDGDEVRQHLSKGLGFSREDRDTNIRRIGFVASEIVRHRGVVICAAISPFREARESCRALMGDSFIEVFVDTDLGTCERRDPKGLYARARAGELKGMTGLDDPYEAPEKPEVRLADTLLTPAENARLIIAALGERGFLGSPSPGV